MPELRSSETVCVQNYTYERSRGQFIVSVPPRVGYRFYARSIAAVCHRLQRQDFGRTRVQYLVSVPHGAVYRRLHECSIALMLHGAGFRHGLRAEIAAEGSVRYAIDARVAGTSAVCRFNAARAVCRSATRAVSAARRGI